METKKYWINGNGNYSHEFNWDDGLSIGKATLISEDDELTFNEYAYENPYELQQNFIIAIYKLLIQRNLINNKQELTKELEKEICEKYIKRKLILNVEKKEDNKIL